MTDEQRLEIAPGMVCYTTWGMVQSVFGRAFAEMRAYSEKQGLANVVWTDIQGALVDKARNEAARRMLQEFNRTAQWLLFVDGDMVPPADGVVRMLSTAYGSHQWADVVGGYCNLRGDLALPTIDTGTGTWESHFPGRGVLEVIRTGAAFLLVKRHVFERLPEPWFATRVPARPLDFMAEVDNWARIKWNGQNPFMNQPGQPWEKLLQLASADPSAQPGQFVPYEVGEDSGFCDKVKAYGMRIVVDTSIAVPHLDQKTVTWADHKTAMDDIHRQWRQAVGVLV